MIARILFVDFDKTEYLPLIRSVAGRGFVPILDDSPLRREVEIAGLPFSKWEAYLPPGLQEKVEDEIERISEQLSTQLVEPQAREVFTSPLGDVLETNGEAFVETLIKLLVDEIVTIEILKRILELAKVRLIVLACDNNHTQRAIVLYARQHGIKTLQLAHGVHADYFTERTAADMFTLFSDYVAVFGNRSREQMVAAGNAAERVFVTGSVRWDAFYEQDVRIDKKVARERLGINPEQPVALYCSSYADGVSAFYPAHSLRLFTLFRKIVHALQACGGQAQLLIRPHPNELRRGTSSVQTQRQLDHLFDDWLERERITLSVRLVRDSRLDVMRAADVVLTVGQSTVNYEAMILQRPVVSLPWFDAPAGGVRQVDGITMLENISELSDLLPPLLSDPLKRQATVNQQNLALSGINYKNDGRATERVTELICNLAGRSDDKEVAKAAVTSDMSVIERHTRPLRILEIVHNFPPFSYAGTELYTLSLVRELSNLGHDVTILHPVATKKTPPYSFENTFYEGLKVTRFNTFDGIERTRSDFFNPAYDEPFSKYLSGNDFDIVHFQHLYGLSANWITIAKAHGRPVFLKIDDMFMYCAQIHLVQNQESHCSGPESLRKCAECVFALKEDSSREEIAQAHEHLIFRQAQLQKKFREVDFVQSPSTFLKETCIRNSFFNNEFHVIPTGITPFKVRPRRARSEQSDNLRVAFLGHIDQRKGIVDFLQAIEIYERELENLGGAMTLGFDIFGHHYEDDLYRYMLSKTRELKDTKYKGRFKPEDRPDIFSKIDLLVMPSIGENYPFVLREALYAGVPVVATEVAGVPEIIQDNKNGFLYPPGDVKALATIFMRLSSEPGMLRQLDTQGQAIKTIDTEAKEIVSEYRRLLVQSEVNEEFGLPARSAVFPTSQSEVSAQIGLLFAKSKRLVKAGKYPEGAAVLAEILKLDPKHFDSIVLLGDLYNKLGKQAQANELWRVAQRTQPHDLGLLKRLNVAVDCSIIIPVFNQIEFTKKCLESIERNTCLDCYEIIFVDNNSTDGTREFLQNSGSARVIRNFTNKGFSIACNQGAEVARHEFILFLNNDMRVLPRWLQPMITVLLTDPEAGVVGAKLLYPDGTIQHAGVITVDDVENSKPLDPWHVYYRLDGSLPEANIAREYPAVTGACLLTRKSLFQELGGFDPTYRNGFEDVDYCYKVGAAGYKIVYEPKSVAIHYESQSGPERFADNVRNFNLLVSRWREKVAPDVRRWEAGRHETLRPFKTYQRKCEVNGRRILTSAAYPG